MYINDSGDSEGYKEQVEKYSKILQNMKRGKLNTNNMITEDLIDALEMGVEDFKLAKDELITAINAIKDKIDNLSPLHNTLTAITNQLNFADKQLTRSISDCRSYDEESDEESDEDEEGDHPLWS